MNKINHQKDTTRIYNSNNKTNHHFMSRNCSGRFQVISMFLLLIVFMKTLYELPQFVEIQYSETDYFISLNLTLLALIFSLEVLPSFIKEAKCNELNITTRLEQEKKDQLVNNTSLVLTLICIGITAINFVKFLDSQKSSINYLSLLDEKVITNSIIFILCVHFTSFFPHLDQIRVHPYINNLESLKRFDDYKQPKRITRFLGDCIVFLTLTLAIINPSSPGDIGGEQVMMSTVIIVLVFFDCYSRSLNIKRRSATKWITLAILLISFCLISFGIYIDLRNKTTPLSLSLSLAFIMLLCALLPLGFGPKSHLGTRFIEYCCLNLRLSTEAELSTGKEQLENLDNKLKLLINKDISRKFPHYNKYKLEATSTA